MSSDFDIGQRLGDYEILACSAPEVWEKSIR